MRNGDFVRGALAGFLLSVLILIGQQARAVAPATAVPLTLNWDASDNPAVIGYAVYYGLAGSSSPVRMDVGPALNATINNLQLGSTYTFSVVAYDDFGIESPLSAPINYTAGLISKLLLNRASANLMKLSFQTAPKTSCAISYVPKLGDPWTPLTTAMSDTNGLVSVLDSMTPGTQSRFYRVIVNN